MRYRANRYMLHQLWTTISSNFVFNSNKLSIHYNCLSLSWHLAQWEISGGYCPVGIGKRSPFTAHKMETLTPIRGHLVHKLVRPLWHWPEVVSRSHINQTSERSRSVLPWDPGIITEVFGGQVVLLSVLARVAVLPYILYLRLI